MLEVQSRLRYACSSCLRLCDVFFSSFFFFNDTATTEIYTLSLHDALPIYAAGVASHAACGLTRGRRGLAIAFDADRKSTRLNSSHSQISYAVFCLKKKKKKTQENIVMRHK